MNVPEEILKWCRSYVRSEEDAVCLAVLMQNMFIKNRRASFTIGFIAGVVVSLLIMAATK